MDRRNLGAVLRHAAAVAGRDPATAAGDRDLLRRFHRDRDDAAFAELVRRHGRLVWAVCRHLVPTDADAEDAFQATFLALLRSAGSVRDGAALGPWLHGVAVRVCSKARRSAARRKRREGASSTAEAGRAVPDSAWDAALATVHEEVARLPDTLRVPFVLCCLEGTGATEAAARLGWKLGTLSGRLTRAKQTLLARLDARGLSAGAIAAAVAGGASTAGVPTAVIDRVAELAQPGMTVPSSILHLSQGVVGMGIHRTKLLAAAVLVAGGLATTGGAGWVLTAGAQPPSRPGTAAEPKSPPPAPKPPAGGEQAGDVETYLRDLAAIQARTTDPAQPARWEYRYVPTKERDAVNKPGFEQAMSRFEGDGWMFVGVIPMRWDGVTGEYPVEARPGEGAVMPTYVFRRPAGEKARAAELNRLLTHELDRLVEERNRQGVLKALLESNRQKAVADALQRQADEKSRADAASAWQRTVGPPRTQADERAATEKQLRWLIGTLNAQLDEFVAPRSKVLKTGGPLPTSTPVQQETERQLTTRIKALEAELAALSGPTEKKDLAVPKENVRSVVLFLRPAATPLGVESGDLATTLEALAKKKFPATKLLFSFEPQSGNLLVSGPRDQVEWVVKLVAGLSRTDSNPQPGR